MDRSSHSDIEVDEKGTKWVCPQQNPSIKDLQLALGSLLNIESSEIDGGRVKRKRVDSAVFDDNGLESVLILHLSHLVKRFECLDTVDVVGLDGNAEEVSLEGPLILDKKEYVTVDVV